MREIEEQAQKPRYPSASPNLPWANPTPPSSPSVYIPTTEGSATPRYAPSSSWSPSPPPTHTSPRTPSPSPLDPRIHRRPRHSSPTRQPALHPPTSPNSSKPSVGPPTPSQDCTLNMPVLPNYPPPSLHSSSYPPGYPSPYLPIGPPPCPHPPYIPPWILTFPAPPLHPLALLDLPHPFLLILTGFRESTYTRHTLPSFPQTSRCPAKVRGTWLRQVINPPLPVHPTLILLFVRLSLTLPKTVH